MVEAALNRKKNWTLVSAALLMLVILGLDSQTPLGVAVWVLYLLPLALTLLQPLTWPPLLLAGAATVFMVIGFYISPPGVAPTPGAVNRAMGAAALWTLAYVIFHALRTRADVRRLLWLELGKASVTQRLTGEQSAQDLAVHACDALCELLGAQAAVIYRLDGRTLLFTGGHAHDPAFTAERIEMPAGLAGQVAASGKALLVNDVPEGHLPLSSALGRSTPRHLLVAPLTADGEPCGVIELGFVRGKADFADEIQLLGRAGERIGLALRSALYRERLVGLLEETQRQSEELQVQQEELRVANEELEEQSRVLRDSQSRLEAQHAEMETTNQHLEEQSQLLEQQKERLVVTQESLKLNASRLEAASRYKSEFLANMSHELRTPLNSSLILSKLLADNREQNLTAEQVKFAQAIHASNNDLLTLINDVLDLSKIEAGHVELAPEHVPLRRVLEQLHVTFEPLARQKALAFSLELAPGCPETVFTDAQRLQQILKNLLANAVKFTARGSVGLRVHAPREGRLAFEVSDSGIGIPPSQQTVIFEAFRQADGSTSRRFGGTGLGLSISRELAQRLGGDIRVDSEPGRGSTFTLDIAAVLGAGAADAPAQRRGRAAAAGRGDAPAALAPPAAAPAAAAASPPAAPALRPADPGAAEPPPGDDRRQRRHPDRLILAVEDDAHFARVLYDLAHELGFDCVIASTAGEALRLARELKPSGILLDVGLPDQSGLGVLERLKRDPATRHVPVHMMSAHDRAHTALELGAVGYVLKPAAREELVQAIERLQERLQRTLRRLLIVEDDATLLENLGLLLRSEHVDITAVGTMAQALEQLAAGTFDCMVLDLSLPDGSGYELLEKMAAGDHVAFPPVIVYTGRAPSRDEEQRLRRYSRSIIVKGARSPERLLDEVTLFLHSVESSLPPEQQRLLRQARQRDAVLDARRILLVEDDVRNIFALSSVFEPLGAMLEIARNGREALERLDGQPEIDLVLMDVMMPEMDGITAMKLIREQPRWANLPVIALTAKAMPDDRERCLDAGANDYVAKPIDIDKLISLCRVWMPK